MNERMMKAVRAALTDVDLVLLIVDASVAFGRGDEFTLALLKPTEKKKILLLNKIDRIEKRALLPIIDRYSRLGAFEEVIPISALSGDNVELLVGQMFQRLPEGPRFIRTIRSAISRNERSPRR